MTMDMEDQKENHRGQKFTYIQILCITLINSSEEKTKPHMFQLLSSKSSHTLFMQNSFILYIAENIKYYCFGLDYSVCFKPLDVQYCFLLNHACAKMCTYKQISQITGFSTATNIFELLGITYFHHASCILAC